MDKICNTRFHDQHDLNDPNSKIVQGVMKIYSMEPPFYGELNRICRKDDSQITEEDMEFFGPYAAALCAAINSEQWRQDKIVPGVKFFDMPNKKGLDEKLTFFNRSFFLFRGVNFTPDDLKQWHA